jgi:signal transduction histidine kinase/DNA-binding NarL/FixJ family response regulator
MRDDSNFLFGTVRLVLLVCAVCFAGACFGFTPIDLTGRDIIQSKELIRHAGILEDTDKNLTPKTVLARIAEFKQLKEMTSISKGYSKSAFWVYFEIDWSGVPEDKQFVFMQRYPMISQVALLQERLNYEPDAKGIREPFSKREYQVPQMIWPLKKGAGVASYLMRFDGGRGSTVLVVPEIFEQKQVTNFLYKKTIVSALFYGALFALLLYNFILYIIIKDKSYIYYCGYLFFLIGCFANFDGYQKQFAELPLDERARPFVIVPLLAWVFGILFSLNLLNFRKYAPFVYKLLLALIVFAILTIAPSSFFLDERYTYLAVYVCICISAIPVSFTVIKAALRGARQNFFGIFGPLAKGTPTIETKVGLYYCIAWAPVICGFLIYSARALGVIESDTFTENVWGISSACEVLLFSVSLGERINLIKKEKDEFQLESFQAQREKDLAQRSAELRTELLANISHDLRDPMHRIITSNTLARDVVDMRVKDELIERSLSNAAHLNSIINKILDHSKLQIGKFDLDRYKFKMVDLLGSIKSCLPPENSKSVKLIINTIDEGAVYVADPYRIMDIIMNLIGNSVKFTREGFIALDVKIEKQTNDVHLATFKVTDTGSGISDDIKPFIFEPFKQGKSIRAGRRAGSGLGLSICYELAQLMQGTIKVESKLGEGSCFEVAIPLEVSKIQPDDGDIDWFVPSYASVNPVEELLSGISVLLVDDIDENRDLFMRHLSQFMARVETTNSGENAIKLIENNEYDLVFMDIQMEGINGYETARIIREKGFTVPIIAMTASASASDKECATRSGMNDFIGKPVDYALMHRLINKWVLKDQANEKLDMRSDLNSKLLSGNDVDFAGLSKSFNSEVELHSFVERGLATLHRRVLLIADAIHLGDVLSIAKVAHESKNLAGLLGLGEIYFHLGDLEKNANGLSSGQRYELYEMIIALYEKIEAPC